MNMRNYYKKKMYGGRSLVARFLDFILLRIFLSFLIFILLLYISRSFTVSLLISVFITTAVSLVLIMIKRTKIAKYMEKDMQRIQQKCLLERLTLMNLDEYAEYINKIYKNNLHNTILMNNDFIAEYNDYHLYVFHNHPSSKCGVSDILSVYRAFKDRKKIMILSLSDFSSDAEKICSSFPMEITLISGLTILETAKKMKLMPDEKSAREKAEKEMNETMLTFKKIKSATFNRGKIKGYLICGIVIFCWPIISGFKIYYPIIALACFAMAIITYKKNKQAKESSDIGIS